MVDEKDFITQRRIGLVRCCVPYCSAVKLLSSTCYLNEEGRSPKRNAVPEHADFVGYLSVTELLLES
jgi:hypothetical protein